MKHELSILNFVNQQIKIDVTNIKFLEFSSYKKILSILYDEILIPEIDVSVYLLILENRGMRKGDQIVMVFKNLYEIEHLMRGRYEKITLIKYNNFKDAFDQALLIKESK